MSVIQRNIAGAASQVAVAVALEAGETGTLVVSASTGWPSTSFVASIDRGTADEEKVLIASRSGNVWTISARGFDGTSARDHAEGAQIELVLDAVMVQAFLDHVNANEAGDVHSQYLLAADLTQAAINDLEVDAHTLDTHTWDDVVEADGVVASAAADALTAAVGTLNDALDAANTAISDANDAIDALTLNAVQLPTFCSRSGLLLTTLSVGTVITTIPSSGYPGLPAGAGATDSRLVLDGFVCLPLLATADGSLKVSVKGATSGTEYGYNGTYLLATKPGWIMVPFMAEFTNASKETLNVIVTEEAPNANYHINNDGDGTALDNVTVARAAWIVRP